MSNLLFEIFLRVEQKRGLPPSLPPERVESKFLCIIWYKLFKMPCQGKDAFINPTLPATQPPGMHTPICLFRAIFH